MNGASRWSLGAAANARGVRLAAFEELRSTNDEAKRLIESGERGPLWIVADRQTEGRGRFGRSWISIDGNLHASLILSGEFAPNLSPQLGFVAGVAALEALRTATGDARGLALKWPNDLLLERAKVGGILLEGVSGPAGFSVVVGIGVNCVGAPSGLPYPARALNEIGAAAPTAAKILTLLSDAFVVSLDEWAEGRGFAETRARWLKGAAGLHETIRVSLAPGEELVGRFESIDADGRLILKTEAGERAVDAGDVFLARGEVEVLQHPGRVS